MFCNFKHVQYSTAEYSQLGYSPWRWLNGQYAEIFCFWFFSWISFPPAPEYSISTVSNFFENSWRYSQVKVHHRYQRPGPNGILRGLGQTDPWKNQKSKIPWHCPFKGSSNNAYISGDWYASLPSYILPAGKVTAEIKTILGSSPYNSCFPPELIVLVLPAKMDFSVFPPKRNFPVFPPKLTLAFFRYCTLYSRVQRF